MKLHLQTVMQTIAICNPSRRSNGYSLYRSTKTKLDCLRVKIAQATSDNGIQLDEGMQVNMLQLSTSEVESAHPEGSFQRIFWEEQKKAVLCKDSRQVQWHPLIIKWCLYMRHKTSGAYETLRSSGLLRLPSLRTLRDYTHYVKAHAGFSSEVDMELVRVSMYKELQEWVKCVTLLIDEMHIKEDLVYGKVTAALIGFTSLGDTNEHLLKVHETCATNTN